MQKLGGGDKFGMEVLNSERLPKATRVILACADSSSLKVLVMMADEIQEVHGNSIERKCGYK